MPCLKFLSWVTMYQSLIPLRRGAFVALIPWPCAPWHAAQFSNGPCPPFALPVTVVGAGVSGSVLIYAMTLLTAAASGSVAAIGAIILPSVSLSFAPREPFLKFSSWRFRYQSCWPASFGALSVGLPSP